MGDQSRPFGNLRAGSIAKSVTMRGRLGRSKFAKVFLHARISDDSRGEWGIDGATVLLSYARGAVHPSVRCSPVG